MYERSAIVLERYFDNWIGLGNKCNLRDNYKNYCNIIEKLEKYQINYQKELNSIKEYNEVLHKIKDIQAEEKELYKKSAKLEYNRNLLFNNIDGKVEDTKKCIEKIEAEVEKNNELMKQTREKYIEALKEYNIRRIELSKMKRYKKMAENNYNEILEVTKQNYEGITSEDLDAARQFANFDDEEDIVKTLIENGSSEKIPFNEDVMRCTTNYSISMVKKEVISYLTIYDKTTKLLEDIENGTTKINLHKKYVRNERSKVDFIYAVKDYITQFLDYERMTVIHGRKSHNRLMSEACENFATDIAQIDNLYELIIREIDNKATKKAYKELYNKTYLIDINEKEEKFKKEKNRVNLNMATLVNTNYWRIEGIRNIYTVFYKNVSEVFGKDIGEFDIPKEFDDTSREEQDTAEDVVVADIIDDGKVETKAEPKPVEEKKPEPSTKKSPKVPFALDGMENVEELTVDFDDDDEYGKVEKESSNQDSDDTAEEDSSESNESTDSEDDGDDEVENSLDKVSKRLKINLDELENSLGTDFDIFGEKYKNIDFSTDFENAAAKSKLDSNIKVFKKVNLNTENESSVFDSMNDYSENNLSVENKEEKPTGFFGRLKRTQGKRVKRNTDEGEDNIW